MSPHDWFVEHRTSFVARTLEPDEERVFEDHLRGCDACRVATEAVARDLAWLPMGAVPVAPRPGLVRRLTETSLGRRTPRRWPGLLALAASMVIAFGSLGWAHVSIRRVEAQAAEERRGLRQALAMVRDTLAILRTADRVRHATITLGAQQGGLVLFADDKTHRWNVVVYGVRAPRPGEVLQFWFITDEGMVRGMEVPSRETGPALLTMGMPPAGGKVMGAALTLEPGDRAGRRPAGKELVHLML